MKEVFCSLRPAPPEPGKQNNLEDGELHFPELKGPGRAFGFPKLSPAVAAAPSAVKPPAALCQPSWRAARRQLLGAGATGPSFWKELSAKLKEAEPEHLAKTHTHTQTHTKAILRTGLGQYLLRIF